MARKDDDKVRPIIKKVKKVQGGGHHGGAWKVAYADFTTAMMAFFMLLWLLNVAPPETLAGLADYFAPTTAAVMGHSGQQAINPPSSKSSGGNPAPVVAISNPGPPQSGTDNGRKHGSAGKGGGNPDYPDDRQNPQMAKQLEDQAFKAAEQQLKLAIQKSPNLSDMKDQVIMEITKDGMKIQLIDKDRRSMFKNGTAQLYDYAKAMIAEIGKSVQNLPNRVTVLGHTDGGPFVGDGGITNWELSANRANAARQVMEDVGVTNDRVAEVVGKAGTDPLYPDQPNRPENRRITILLLREAPVVPSNLTGH